MKVRGSHRHALTLAFTIVGPSIALGQGGSNASPQQGTAPNIPRPSVVIAPSEGLSPNPETAIDPNSADAASLASRGAAGQGFVQAPVGTSAEVAAIQAYLRSLESQLQPPDGATSSGLFAAGGGNAALTSSNPTLQTSLGQARYDLTNANERAAIAARAQYNRSSLRSAYDVTHSARAITSPTHVFQSTRNERTGIHIRMMDSLPGPQDPNDLLNHAADGTSSLRSFQLVPFWRTAHGSATLSEASPGTLSANADGSDAALLGAVAGEEYLDPNPSPKSAAKANDDPALTHQLDFGFQVRPGMIYDSGTPAEKGVYSPGTINLSHSAASHSNGTLTFNSEKQNGQNGFLFPFRPQIGYGINDKAAGSIAASLDLLSLSGNTPGVRTAAVRYIEPMEEFGFSFGKMETLFGDLGTASGTAVTGALMVGTVATTAPSGSDAGTSFSGTNQFRLMRYWHNTRYMGDITEMSLSLEDPSAIDNSILYRMTATPGDANFNKSESNYVNLLHRYPTIVSRLRYGGSNGFDSVQLAGLVLPIGFDSSNAVNNFHESFDTALGLSTNARFELGNHCLRDTFYIGAVGGRGVGGYIFGNLPSAVLTSVKTAVVDDIKLVDAIGGYCSYRRVWTVFGDGSNLSSNFMGGLANASDSLDSTDALANNRQVYQTGANLVWNKGQKFNLGLEYQYGSRLVQGGSLTSDTHGENHRVALLLQITPINSSLTPSGGRSLTSRSSSLRASTANDFNEAATDSRSSNKSKMRF